MKMKQSKIYKRLEDLSENDSEIKSLLTIVDGGVSYAEARAKTTIRYMDEYTLHDEAHLYRILNLMELIIPEETLNNLQALELSLLILSAFFHDLGMSPKEREIKIYKGLINSDQELNAEEKKKLEDFEVYCETKINLKQRIEKARETGNSGLAKILESYRLTEYIRINHASKVKEIIEEVEKNEDWAKGLKYSNFQLGRYLASICESHNENILKYNSPLFKTSILVRSNEYLNSVFISIVLRLADILDFDAERTPNVLFNHLDIQNPISLREWSKHRSILAWNINENNIMYAAECEHPAIEKSIKEFCEYIEEEIYFCKIKLKDTHDGKRNNLDTLYNLPLPYKVDTTEVKARVDYDGNPIYIYKDLSFNLNQEEITKLLMGTSLYGNSSVAIRELLQNAIDACKIRIACAKIWGDIGYKPKIEINVYENDGEKYLEIIDNGIGMDENIILNYFSNLGKSFYKSEEFFKLKYELKSSYKPISNFGIGFLSTMMISDQVKVQTRKISGKFDFSEPIDLTIDSLSGLFYFNTSKIKEVGTRIQLKIKKENQLPLKNEELRNYIESQINFIDDIDFYVNNESINVTRSELSYKEFSENYTYVKYYNLEIDENGIKGTFKIPLLEENKLFHSRIVINEYDFNGYELSEYLAISNNSIHLESDSLGTDGTISSGWSDHIVTWGKFYIKSILVEDNLFSGTKWYSLNENEHYKINLPFPIIFNMNLSAESELHINLNAARDKIILDSNWEKFKNTFIKVILKNLFKQFESIERVESFIDVYKSSIKEKEVIDYLNELEIKRKKEITELKH